jgi:SAM-dependent methyltransferase
MAASSLHQEQILKNRDHWQRKPLLRRIYRDFYRLIAGQLSRLPDSQIVELGSGLGKLKEVVPESICTDIFPNPWIDRVENAYALSFADESVSDLLLFDVFHHLRFPGTVLQEFRRVLRPGGRVIIFDPCISVLGMLVYGLAHPEPVGFFRPIEWLAPDRGAGHSDYYAAQGYATRIFLGRKYLGRLAGWGIKTRRRFSALAYVGSGGYSGPQLYPTFLLPVIRRMEPFFDLFPILFATRILIVLEKPGP